MQDYFLHDEIMFSWYFAVMRNQEAVEELLTKQRSDIKLLREAEAKVRGVQNDAAPHLHLTALRKAARLELEVESLKGQLAQSKVPFISDSRFGFICCDL